MANKKVVAKKTPAKKVEKPEPAVEEIKEKTKTVDDLTLQQRELRYYILRLGVRYGSDNLKEVLGVIASEMRGK